MSGPVFDALRGPAGYYKQAIAAEQALVPIGLTEPVGAVLLCPRAGNAYWRDDGVAATVADGFPLLQDTTFYYVGDLSKVSVIGDAATELHCSFYF